MWKRFMTIILNTAYVSLLFHNRCENHPVGKGSEVIWSVSCMVKMVGWSSQSTCSAHPQRQVASTICRDASTIPIELVLFCVPPLPPPQARPSGHYFLPGPLRWPLKWSPFSRFCPLISPFCRQLSGSSFKKQIQRSDSE